MPHQVFRYGKCKQAKVSSLYSEEIGLGQVSTNNQVQQENTGSCAPPIGGCGGSCHFKGKILDFSGKKVTTLLLRMPYLHVFVVLYL